MKTARTAWTMTARRPTLWLLLATVAVTIGFLGSEADARRRNPLEESVDAALLQSSERDRGSHRKLSEDLASSALRRTIGKNVDVPVANSPDDHLVKDLPLLDPDDFQQDHWAGLLPVNDKGDGYLFYWLFAPDPQKLELEKQKGLVKNDESNVPLLVWLNGGPACSSMDGLWLENGPFRLDPGGGGPWNKMKLDSHSWHKAPAYTLYIDQPVGTGLAFTTSGDYPNNDERVNEDFYYFMTEFMKLHGPTLGVTPNGDHKNLPTLQRPFFFSGESHAGHYIPSMMNYIRKKNLDTKWLKKNDGVVMPLTGAAIGNGWFDPIYQYSAQDVAYGYGLIGKAQQRSLAEKEELCRADLRRQDYSSNVCFGLLHDVVGNSLGINNPKVVSQYDQRIHEDRKKNREFPFGHKDVEAYLGHLKNIPNVDTKDVLAAIHATPSWKSGQRYRECTDPPYNALSHQDGLGVVPDIVDLLEHDDNGSQIRLLFFNGVHDLICNHVGNENALEHLPWKNREKYVQASRYGWNAPTTGKVGGYAKEFQNLIFLKVLDSGHMVPMDIPEIALDMMVAFMYSTGPGTFDTYEQKLIRGKVDETDGGGGENCQNCPACDDKCTKDQCVQDFHLMDDGMDDDESSSTVLAALRPAHEGVLAGVITFTVLAMLVRCCCPGALQLKVSGGSRGHKINMDDSSGGYRDDDSLDDEIEMSRNRDD